MLRVIEEPEGESIPGHECIRLALRHSDFNFGLLNWGRLRYRIQLKFGFGSATTGGKGQAREQDGDRSFHFSPPVSKKTGTMRKHHPVKV
jgi:hypothetical protein